MAPVATEQNAAPPAPVVTKGIDSSLVIDRSRIIQRKDDKPSLEELQKINENKLPLDWDPNDKYAWALPWFSELYKHPDYSELNRGTYDRICY